jgi:hypothetical protein
VLNPRKPFRRVWIKVTTYCQERKNQVDPSKWFDFYQSKGWLIGKSRMKTGEPQLELGKEMAMEVHSMTVTRKQGEETDNALTHRSSEQIITQEQSLTPSLKWPEMLFDMAQSKSRTLTSGTVERWKVKLKKYSDAVICEALTEGRWEWFPDVDHVLDRDRASSPTETPGKC